MIELDPYPTESEMTGYASLEERKARNSDKFIPPERPSKKQKHGDEESPGGQQDVMMTGLYTPTQPAAAPGDRHPPASASREHATALRRL